MAKPIISTKRLMIDKANSAIVITVAVASFVTIFSLVASKALLSQRAYQARVTKEKEKAVKQLKTNVDNVSTLQNSYKAFIETPENVLGGNPNGNGDKDGDNAKIVLDALPSKYDFPAVATSLEKILTSQNVKIDSISGTDNEVQQLAAPTSPTPTPVDMPFEVAFEGNYQNVQNLILTLEKSIRPIQTQTLQISAQDAGNLRVTLDAKTYYQPTKSLKITTKVVQ